ncbi:Tn3 family transposase, partial [Escherichia coli]|uniref:Tn3 family transposase n=1 Tax=Escherichia coli TaxID=562 RepID=UPI001125A9AF
RPLNKTKGCLIANFATVPNLLTAVIIYWNTVHLGHAVTERRNEGLDVPPEFLPHISPLGWAHILLTGEYLWPKEPKA